MKKNNLQNFSKNFFKKKIGSGKRVLIFGGAGYIGSVLVESLINLNYSVTIYDKFIYNEQNIFNKLFGKKKIKIIKGDSQNISKIFQAIRENDIVVHLAEMVGDPLCDKKPEKTYAINFLASITISSICKNLGINKFIYVSSCSVYGSNNSITNEKSKLNPLSIYAKLKVLCEKTIIKNFDKKSQVSILRLGTVYGASPRPRYDLVVNLFSGLIANNKEIKIAGGNQWRPFTHVKDVSRAIIYMIKSKNRKADNQIFNVVGENVRIQDLGKFIKKINPDAKIKYEKNIKDNRNYRSSNKKIHKILNFKTKYNLQFGIREIIKQTKNKKIKNIFDKKYINVLNHSKF